MFALKRKPLKCGPNRRTFPSSQRPGALTYKTCFLRRGWQAGRVREGPGVVKGVWFITDGEVWGCLCVRKVSLSHDMEVGVQEGSHPSF